VVGTATSYGLDDTRVGVRVLVIWRIFLTPRRPHRLCGLPSLLFQGYRRIFPSGCRVRSVNLTTHLQLVPRWRKMWILHYYSHIRLHGAVLNTVTIGTTLLLPLHQTCRSEIWRLDTMPASAFEQPHSLGLWWRKMWILHYYSHIRLHGAELNKVTIGTTLLLPLHQICRSEIWRLDTKPASAFEQPHSLGLWSINITCHKQTAVSIVATSCTKGKPESLCQQWNQICVYFLRNAYEVRGPFSLLYTSMRNPILQG
jgi:hypothetical protein